MNETSASPMSATYVTQPSMYRRILVVTVYMWKWWVPTIFIIASHAAGKTAALPSDPYIAVVIGGALLILLWACVAILSAGLIFLIGSAVIGIVLWFYEDALTAWEKSNK